MRGRSGQAYLESLLAVLAVLAALFGGLQTALLFGERVVLRHAAARAARARAVGFNDWMAGKAARVAAIPVSGRLRAAELGLGDAVAADGGAALERGRIPSYLAAENQARAEWILDYDEWHGGRFGNAETAAGAGGGVLEYRVRHDAPVEMPLGPFFVPAARPDETGLHRLRIRGVGVAPDHADAYLRGSR